MLTVPVRVLHVLEGLHCGGTETVILNWLRNINRENIRFDFALYNLDDMFFKDEVISYGSKIFSVKPKNIKSFKTSWYIAFNLYKLIKQEKNFTVLQSHEEQPFVAGLQMFVAFVAGIKKRVTISHIDRNEYSAEGKTSVKNKIKVFIGRILIKLFSNVHLAVSKQAGIAMYGKYINFSVINNGIDTEKFKYSDRIRKDFRKKLNINDNDYIVGHVGRLSKQKNSLFVADVFYETKKNNKNVKLLIVGDGELREQFYNRIKKYDLSQQIIHLKNISDIYNYYQVMDCFLFPSIYEGLGIVAVEAQCSGLPCFISDVIPKEATICNTTRISLSKSAKEWADIILEKTKNFERKDCSSIIKNKGFDSKTIGEIIQKIYE